MAPNVHIHIPVSNVERSAAFYEAVFGAPVKVKPGYRKFLPAFAPLNLAISEGRVDRTSASAPLRSPVRDPGAVRAHLTRVKALGLPVREEMSVDCCHANQDKFWVSDPDGIEWELYAINYDLEDEPAARAPATSSCCAGATGSGGAACPSPVTNASSPPI